MAKIRHSSSPARSLAKLGPLWVGLGALLWATDALFRYPLLGKIDSAWIVFSEHAVAALVLLPFLISSQGSKLFKLTFKDLLGVIFVGVGASAAATLLFTMSFGLINPSVTILLQKLQPVLVVLIARMTLGEKPRPSFYGWAAIALGAAIALSVSEWKVSWGRIGVTEALLAATIWAVATVVGRSLLQRLHTSVVTFWRFIFGLIALGIFLVVMGFSVPWDSFQNPKLSLSLIYIGLVPGLFAMLAYYQGLAQTPAAQTTIIELIFPLAAVVLNWIFLGTPLSSTQIVAGSVLVLAVAYSSRPAKA